MQYTHAVIDLETLSTRPEAVVVAIGAVKFDPSRDDGGMAPSLAGDPRRAFYRAAETPSQTDAGRKTDHATLGWWCEQGIEARRLTFPAMPTDTDQALRAFAAWMEGVEYLWGNGAAFDNAILRSLCADYEVPYPVSYKGDMCVRTIELAAGVPKRDFIGIKHYALHDAFNEALVIQD
ncbi:MAG: 3'-5' exonuclease, partial [Gammaproteobacteria bacterium]